MTLSKPHLDPKTNRLTTLTESHRTIDQTTPHQLVVSQILGAIICDPALRIIRTDDRSRPYVTMTDMLADLRGAADLAVSFDGSFNYGLLIEVKTTTKQSRSDLGLFYEVTDTDRNKTQLERLVKGAPSWWYVIVNTSKLTAKTHSEHVRAILDCPAVFIEGKGGDTRPMHIMSFNAFSGLLDEMQDCILNLDISKAQPLPAPYHQMDLLPVDDVPVVTMDQPLRQPVIAPAPAPTPAPVAVVKRSLPNRAFEAMWQAALREIEICGGFETWSQKLPQSLLTVYIDLSKAPPEERLLSDMKGHFVKQKRHHTQLGTLLIAWLCDSDRSAFLLRQATPEMAYTVYTKKNKSGQPGKLNLISALANDLKVRW